MSPRIRELGGQESDQTFQCNFRDHHVLRFPGPGRGLTAACPVPAHMSLGPPSAGEGLVRPGNPFGGRKVTPLGFSPAATLGCCTTGATLGRVWAGPLLLQRLTCGQGVRKAQSAADAGLPAGDPAQPPPCWASSKYRPTHFSQLYFGADKHVRVVLEQPQTPHRPLIHQDTQRSPQRTLERQGSAPTLAVLRGEPGGPLLLA